MLDTAFTEIYLPFWDNLFEVKFEWEENHAPQISEIILLTDKKYGTDHTALDEFIKSLDVKEKIIQLHLIEYLKKHWIMLRLLMQITIVHKQN